MAHISGKGVKRKYEEQEEVYHACQRKYIIDMSMGKLRTSASRRSEPCLRRSVLILNTLKHIESELAQEGVDTHQSTEAARNEIPEMNMTQLTLDPLPDVSTFICPLPALSPNPFSSETSAEGNSSNYFALVDSAVIDLLPCKPQMGCQDQVLSQASLEHYSALLPSAAFSSPTSYNTTSLLPQASSLCPSSPVLDALPPSVCCNSLSSNPEVEPAKGCGNGDPNNNLTEQGPYSVSSSAFEEECLNEEEVLEFLHSLQETSDSVPPLSTPPTPASQSSASVLNAQCSTYCRSDSSLDDLDSIMQILVGMWKESCCGSRNLFWGWDWTKHWESLTVKVWCYLLKSKYGCPTWILLKYRQQELWNRCDCKHFAWFQRLCNSHGRHNLLLRIDLLKSDSVFVIQRAVFMGIWLLLWFVWQCNKWPSHG